MTGDQTASLIYSLLFLMLIASSLVARRLPIGQTLKYALAWVAIFSGGIVLFSFRHQAGQAWEQVKREINPDAPIQSGQSIRILKDDDGHFHVDASVNGRRVKFLIDSGATTSTMSKADAEAAGVVIDDTGFGAAVDTANGMAIMRRARIDRLTIGTIERMDHAILVSEDMGEMNLLGMNYLSSLQSWRVEGREMILTP